MLFYKLDMMRLCRCWMALVVGLGLGRGGIERMVLCFGHLDRRGRDWDPCYLDLVACLKRGGKRGELWTFPFFSTEVL
ncbi:hypothetical protein B0O99DRAFT_619446, partial [Bisporella sp. PMI_857]